MNSSKTKRQPARLKPDLPPTTEQLAFRLAGLDSLIADLRPGQPLTELQWLEVRNVLEAVRQGVDPRKHYGIKPAKPGPRSQSNTGFNGWIGGHYWHLRRQGEKAVVALSLVSEAWGVGPDLVRKVATPNRKAWADRLEGGRWTTKQFTAMASTYKNLLQDRH